MVLDAIVIGSAACSELYYRFTYRLDAVVNTYSCITNNKIICVLYTFYHILRVHVYIRHFAETDLVKLIFRSVARYVSVKFTRYIRALE